MAAADPASRIWRTLTAGRRKIVLAVAVVVLIVGGVGSRQANNYLTHDKAYCLSCHDSAQADLANSSHAKLDCSACHQSKLGQNAMLYVKKLSEGTKANAPHSPADRKRCNVCHLSGQGGDEQINTTVGHESHVLRGPKSDCTACHGSDSHKLTPKPDVCSTCHADVKIFHGGTKDMSCLSCHNVLAKTSSARKPASTDCQRCHGGSFVSA